MNHRAKLLIAIDDTDCPEQGGTGRVARTVASRLGERHSVWGVTRHQLAVLPEINYTRRNSANVVHLLDAPHDLSALAAEVGGWVGEMAVAGSQPGVCLARPETLLNCNLGAAAQTRVVSRDEIRRAAGAAEARLLNPLGEDEGIVGAYAAACLAADGNDGRFVDIGRIRSLSGELSCSAVLAAGIDEICSDKGRPVTEGIIKAERLRPAFRGGKCVLYCRSLNGGWIPIVGAPGDKEKEELAREG